MSGGSSPAQEVHNFLGRPGPRRSTRTLADHLAPRPGPAPRAAAPAPPAPAPRPAPSPAVRPAPRPAAVPTPAPARPTPVRAAPPVVRPAAAAPPPLAEVGRARVSEERLVLDDEAPVTTITAAQREGGTLRILLQWQRQVTSGGLQRSTDVHLGCLWETQDRHRGAVQSLGDLLMAPGYGARQVLRLGPRSEEAGEELLVDGRHVDVLRRMVLFLYAAHDPAPDFTALAPHLTLRRRDGGRLQAWAQGAPPGSRTCALVSVHDVGGDLVVRRENEFFPGPQAEVAEAYGFDDIDWGPDGTTPRTA